MKKLFSFMLMAAMVSALTVSCDKDDNGNNGGKTDEKEYRLKSYGYVSSSGPELYEYSYNTEGKITKVYREDDDGKRWDVTYSGSTVTFTSQKTGSAEYVITLGANGYAASMVDKYDETRTYEYDSKGHMTKVSKEGEKRSDITIQDECIKSWTRYSSDTWQTKQHTYSTKPNIAKIHNIYSEATDPSRWMYETGLFGIPSAYLCDWNKWEHSDVASTFEYEFDDNDYVTKETKTYDGKDEVYVYNWEEVPE